MDDLSIGKIARAANVSADTVRYYERMGLISAPPVFSCVASKTPTVAMPLPGTDH